MLAASTEFYATFRTCPSKVYSPRFRGGKADCGGVRAASSKKTRDARASRFFALLATQRTTPTACAGAGRDTRRHAASPRVEYSHSGSSRSSTPNAVRARRAAAGASVLSPEPRSSRQTCSFGRLSDCSPPRQLLSPSPRQRRGHLDQKASCLVPRLRHRWRKAIAF